MAAFTIPGITPDSIKETNATAKEGVGKPFPVNGNWQNFTGLVTKVETKVLGDDEYLSLRVKNGGCGAEILISTEPQKTYQPKDDADHDAQFQRNVETLKKAIKALNIMDSRGRIDPESYAGGAIIAFGAKLKGWREHNGRQYPKVGTIFNGTVSALIPVEPMTGQGATPAADDDIPF